MKRAMIGWLTLVLCLLMTGATVQAALVSTFETTVEGWTATGDWQSFGFNPSDGNPAGSLKMVDQATGAVVYFVAPTGWQGNWTTYIKGTLSYDLKLISSGGSPYSDDDIRIYSGVNYLSRSFIASLPTSWTHYSVQLIPSNFTAHGDTFANIMANVTSLQLRAEYITGDDTEGLDNVRVVPLPPTVGLLALGLVGLYGWRRKSAT